MTVLNQPTGHGSLDALLGDGIRSLDITEAEHVRAVGYYNGLGDVLEDHWQSTRGENVITSQGSFTLGTVVRNIHRNDDIDLDAVAIRDIEKASISQAALKADAGVAVGTYARSQAGLYPTISECHRCWTLTWPGMHLDLLPAIPNLEAPGILITDKDVVQWQESNPVGYAEWFRLRMLPEFLEAREAKARFQIDEVPDWQVKTTLQQSVQALKRHRDIFFTGRLDDRPASVIVTTLAALAYTGGGDLYEVLRSITRTMGDHVLRDSNGNWVVANPVQPKENFADSWEHHPERAQWFFRWLDAAINDFNGFGARTGLNHTLPLLSKSFGERFSIAAGAGYGTRLHTTSNGRGHTLAATGTLVASHATETTRKARRHGFEGGGTPN